jgi:hypothetical protein
MHAVFYLVGIKRCVDEVIQWLETRNFMLPFENPDLNPAGPKNAQGDLLRKGTMLIGSQLRPGLFGTWEYVFPEPEKDVVLKTLRFNEPVQEFKPDALGGPSLWSNAKIKVKIAAMRKLLGLEKIPDFDKSREFFMPKEAMVAVRFIPIGVRYDVTHKFSNGLIHEAL